ncbi:exosome component 10-like [Stegodyphus dumicola]|uniref:exosome component 10-like n=1 Tax=Stegodyphus dumicola TaxID=202533 RepID=UPI0015B2E1FA|nr:exosome component 10-like [Stegodyphus dumicola]
MNGNDEQPNDGPFLINVYKDVQSYYQDALRSILTATRASCDLPAAGVDFDYYSSFNGFKAFLVREGQSILSLMTCLIQSQGIREKFQGSELEEKFDLLTEVNNVILDNVSTNLDEASGLKKTEEELILAVKPQSSINTSWNKKQFNSNCPQSYKLLTAKNISRPQLAFKDKIDNTNSIFVPIIKEKPNSIKTSCCYIREDVVTEKSPERMDILGCRGFGSSNLDTGQALFIFSCLSIFSSIYCKKRLDKSLVSRLEIFLHLKEFFNPILALLLADV